jgi:hypothetical protein
LKAKIIAATVALVALTNSNAVDAAVFVTGSASAISSPTNFNGFENLPSAGESGSIPYTDGGIKVAYVGTAFITTSLTTLYGFQGNGSWYENGGGTGYTDVKLANGADFQAVQFLLNSGWGGGSTILDYQLLNNGVVVLSGSNPTVGNSSVSQIVGFSGGGFDEIRLQVQNSLFDVTPTLFSATATDAGAYDNFTVLAAVPESSTWAMMILGFVGIGTMTYRRRKSAMLAA